jgi:hypothetical protein
MDNKKTETTFKEIIEGTADTIMSTIGVKDDVLKGELCCVLHKIAATKIIQEMAVTKKK